MSPGLAFVLYVGLCAASVALWLDQAIRRACIGWRVTT